MHTFKRLSCSIAVFFAAVVSIAAQQAPVAVAPMHFRGLMPVIEVKLNGQGPFAFAIDTGGGMQADIDPSVATKLKLDPVGEVLHGDPSLQNDRRLEITRIDSLSFGGAEFRNVTALIRPQRITKDYPNVDGILGFALFTDYLLTLDYPAMQVRLTRGELPAANGSDILSFEIENRVPVIEIAIGRIRMKAHVDSGNYVAGFILPEDIVQQLHLLSPPVTVGRARSVNNQIEIKQAQLKDTIHIGSFRYPQATIAFPALSNTNVGFKVLREFALTFDQKNKRMKFDRRPGGPVTCRDQKLQNEDRLQPKITGCLRKSFVTHPLNLPFLPESSADFATYDLFKGRTIKISFARDRLVVHTKDGDVVATKLKK